MSAATRQLPDPATEPTIKAGELVAGIDPTTLAAAREVARAAPVPTPELLRVLRSLLPPVLVDEAVPTG